MIRYFSRGTYQHTMGVFLSEWAPELIGDVKEGEYNLSLFSKEVFEAAKDEIWIFSDLERLSEYQLNCLKIITEQIKSYNPDFLILNDPRYWKGRKALLEELFRLEHNNFNVWPVTESPARFRYPVFIRNQNEHFGALTTLIEGEDQFKKSLMGVLISGHDPAQLIVVEYEDIPTEDGYFKKYSAFRFFDRIVPAHIVYSQDWVAKVGSPQTKHQLAEVESFLSDNPHDEELREIFNLSGISYGRIDYSMKDGSIQTWEINTNPQLMQERAKYQDHILPIKERVTKIYAAELARLSAMKAPKGVPPGYNFNLAGLLST